MGRVPVRTIALLLVAVTLGASCASDETVAGTAPATSGPPSTSVTTSTLPPSTQPATTSTTAAMVATTTPSSTTTSTRASAAPAGGCPAVDGYRPVGGGRRALVRAPKSAGRRPAVVVLHGYTGTPERIEQTSGWTAFAGPKDVAVAYAEGTPVSGGGFAWTTGSARYSAAGADDIGYLDALASMLADTACVDPARILLTGESNGGAMTLLAACDARTQSRFAMFAPVIPAVDAHVVDRCGAGPPLRFTAIASRLDRTVPYDGTYPAGQIPLSGQEQWFLDVAARRNSCNATNPGREAIRDAEVIRPTGCATAPTLIAVADGAHTWPGGPVGTGGLSPGAFGATAYLWDRFSAG